MPGAAWRFASLLLPGCRMKPTISISGHYGIEMVARDGAGEGNQQCGPDAVAIWKCVRVSPGVELHMSCDLPKPKPAMVEKVLVWREAERRRSL